MKIKMLPVLSMVVAAGVLSGCASNVADDAPQTLTVDVEGTRDGSRLHMSTACEMGEQRGLATVLAMQTELSRFETPAANTGALVRVTLGEGADGVVLERRVPESALPQVLAPVDCARDSAASVQPRGLGAEAGKAWNAFVRKVCSAFSCGGDSSGTGTIGVRG
jgi:hypothetical protein